MLSLTPFAPDTQVEMVGRLIYKEVKEVEEKGEDPYRGPSTSPEEPERQEVDRRGAFSTHSTPFATERELRQREMEHERNIACADEALELLAKGRGVTRFQGTFSKGELLTGFGIIIPLGMWEYKTEDYLTARLLDWRDVRSLALTCAELLDHARKHWPKCFDWKRLDMEFGDKILRELEYRYEDNAADIFYCEHAGDFEGLWP